MPCPKCKGDGLIDRDADDLQEFSEWVRKFALKKTCDVCGGNRVVDFDYKSVAEENP